MFLAPRKSAFSNSTSSNEAPFRSASSKGSGSGKWSITARRRPSSICRGDNPTADGAKPAGGRRRRRRAGRRIPGCPRGCRRRGPRGLECPPPRTLPDLVLLHLLPIPLRQWRECATFPFGLPASMDDQPGPSALQVLPAAPPPAIVLDGEDVLLEPYRISEYLLLLQRLLLQHAISECCDPEAFAETVRQSQMGSP